LIFLFLFLPLQSNADILGEASLYTPLVSYYTTDEVSGVRGDSKGTNNLSDFNTVGSATGKINLAADFESTNSEYLAITDGSQSGLDLTTHTIAAVVKFETVPGSARFDIVTKYNSGTSRSYRFQAGDGNQLLSIQLGAAGTNYCAKSWTPTTGVWYYVATTFNDSTNETKLYVDNSQLGTTCTGMSATPYNGTADFRIGAGQDAGNYFDGLIDEVYIGSSALDATALSLLWDGGAILPYDTIDPELVSCVYTNNFDMNSTIGQTCVTEGATTTCEYTASPTSTAIWIQSGDFLLMFGMILFFLSILTLGFFWSPFRKM